MAVHMLQGKDIRVMIADEHGNYVNFGPTVPDVTYPQVSMVTFGPSYFDATWTEAPIPQLARDELEEIRYRKGLEKKTYPEDRPPSNRKEKRRQAAIARKGRKDG